MASLPEVFSDGITDEVEEDSCGVEDPERSDSWDVGGENVSRVHTWRDKNKTTEI